MKTIGGQAVIEGVMMKSQKGWTVAVRDQSGQIHLLKEPLDSTSAFSKYPILRGITALYHALFLGIRALEFSASKAYEGTEEKPMSKSAIGMTIAFSLGLGSILFIFLPLLATKLIGSVVTQVADKSFLFNFVDGIARVLIFLMYIGGVGLWSEMRRIFQYHGAEHKVIHAFEEGKPLIPKDVMHYSSLHPRCGTSFLLIVMVISIVVFSFIPQSAHFVYKLLWRLILIPLIAGISYELLRLSSKLKDNILVRIMIYPGLMLQRMTTREPDEAQIEVAITALNEVLLFEKQADKA